MDVGCVIVSGGDFGDFEAKCLKDSANGRASVIACDSGYAGAARCGVMPDLCIGDYDSIDPQIFGELENAAASGDIELIRLNPVKDDTDTEAALRTALDRTEGDILILGGFGSRFDHMLANVEILAIALQEGRNAFLWNANNRIRLLDKPLVMERTELFGEYVSFFPFGGPVKGLTLEGFYYPLRDADYGSGTSLGASNRAVDERISVTFSEGILVMIESRD